MKTEYGQTTINNDSKWENLFQGSSIKDKNSVRTHYVFTKITVKIFDSYWGKIN